MASKITNEQIIQMNILYQRYHTYSAVAREIGCAPTTVKKYIQKDFVNPENLNIKRFEGEIKPLTEEEIEKFRNSENWGKFCILSEKEKEGIYELQKEIVI